MLVVWTVQCPGSAWMMRAQVQKRADGLGEAGRFSLGLGRMMPKEPRKNVIGETPGCNSASVDFTYAQSSVGRLRRRPGSVGIGLKRSRLSAFPTGVRSLQGRFSAFFFLCKSAASVVHRPGQNRGAWAMTVVLPNDCHHLLPHQCVNCSSGRLVEEQVLSLIAC